MQKIKPFADLILIKEKQEDMKEEKTESGILLPENARSPKMYAEAEVIDVGDGIKDLEGKMVPLDIKKGQKILFVRNASCIEVDDNLLIKERNIIAIIK